MHHKIKKKDKLWESTKAAIISANKEVIAELKKSQNGRTKTISHAKQYDLIKT